jgi:hypothetical protein
LDVSPHHADFVILLFEVVQHQVAQRDESYQRRPITYWEVTESVLAHDLHAGFRAFRWIHGKWLSRHDFLDSRGAAIEAFHNYPAHKVPLGEDTHEQSIAKHWDSTDIAVHHGSGDVEYKLAGVCAVGLLVTDQIENLHLPPPGFIFPNPRKANAWREYMTKR